MKSKHRNTVVAAMLKVIPLATFLLIMIWLATRYFALNALEEEVSDRLEVHTHMTSMAMADRLHGLIEYGQILSHNDLIINSLIDFSERKNYLPTFFQSLQIPNAHKGVICLLDYRGRQIISNTTHSHIEIAPSKIDAIMQGNNLFEVIEGQLFIAFPIIYNNHTEGILYFELKKTDLKKLLQINNQTVTITVVLKDTGNLTYALNDGIYNPSESNINTSKERPGSDSVNWITQSIQIPGYPDFEIMCSLKTESAFSSYKRTENFLIWAMLLDLLALILGIFFSTKLTAKPVQDFAELIRVARMNKSLSPILPETGTPETASLATAFNRLMSEREQAREELLIQAVESGRAQLSAMVLHNIGNALTPLDPLLSQIESIMKGKIEIRLFQCLEEINKNKHCMTEYITQDEQGKQIYAYLASLPEAFKSENDRLSNKLTEIQNKVNHISEIVYLHQVYAPGNDELKTNCNINFLINSALQFHRNAFENSKIDIKTTLIKDIPYFKIDKNRLMQVIFNLIQNSYEAIEVLKNLDVEHRIEIESFSSNRTVGFKIKDSGIGINPEDISQVFKFGHSKKGSFGISLHYCKQFVEANKGSISLSSKGLDTGSVVKVEFPIAGYNTITR